MLIVFEKIRKIEKKLIELKEKNKIIDYRLILKLNMSVNLYVVTDILSDIEIKSEINTSHIDIELEVLSKEERSTDEYYASLFKNTTPLDFGLRRSLSNVMEYNESIDIKSCPIISFYSYKGGVGRTTALALFASHYAMHSGKKVFVIDCDFEAPGLINFYGINNAESSKNGLVEYLKDKEAYSEITLRDDYVYEVSRVYSGKGEIFLLPAGNIFDEIDRHDYLEALARLDIHSTSTIVDQFKDLIKSINQEYEPDVILIDSKTGFNDIFGIIANKLSDVVIGFFGNNIQNRPGLHFFFDSLFLNKKQTIGLIIVLSIISTSFNKKVNSFKHEIEAYIQNNLNENFDSLPTLPVLGLSRETRLENIGTDIEDIEDFVDLIERKRLNDYEELFSEIEQFLHTIADFRKKKENDVLKRSGAKEDSSSKKTIELKKIILNKLSKNFPQPYAENMDFGEDFLLSQFYFRKCMEDIFNADKFLLLGGKGTGKTAFYQALRHKNFFTTLRKRAQKQKLFEYQVLDMISLKEDPLPKRVKYFDTANFDQSNIQDSEYFYKRFWVVFIWNAIRLDIEKFGFKPNIQLEVQPMLNDAKTAEYLKTYILDQGLFTLIEQELYEIDRFLKHKNYYLMILFDRLDEVVKPNLWSKAISPLIRYSQTNNFKRILPKLFIRRDLFHKLGNLTNKVALENQSINLEWTREELYAFFFKVIFANCQDEFFNYARRVKTISEVRLKKIQGNLRRSNSYNQLDPTPTLLRPLVDTFFGKYADTKGSLKYGEMYDWIFRNLKNADFTISLRPFLDLIKYAIEIAERDPDLNYGEYPVLSSKCTTNIDVRVKAVERHFTDLAMEEGNEFLALIFEDIRNNKVSKKLKMAQLNQNEFEELINSIKKQHDELKNMSFVDLENILILNGIISFSYTSHGTKKYTFAYLYNYYLGLRSLKRRTISM